MDSRSSSYSSLVSAITIDESLGHISSGAAANTAIRGGTLATAALEGRLANGRRSAPVPYSDDVSASLMTTGTAPSPDLVSRRSFGGRHYHHSHHQQQAQYDEDEHLRRCISSPLPLWASLPPRRVSRFDMVCLNPPSSSEGLKAPIHPNSQRSGSDHHDDVEEDDAYDEDDDHIDSFNDGDNGGGDRHPPMGGCALNVKALPSLSELVSQVAQCGDGRATTTRSQETTLTTKDTNSSSNFQDDIAWGSSTLQSSLLGVNGTEWPPVARQSMSSMSHPAGVAAHEGNTKITNSITKIVPNQLGPNYLRRTLSLSSRRRYSLGPLGSSTTCSGSKHTNVSNPVVEGNKKRNSHELLEVEVDVHSDTGVWKTFQGGCSLPPKRFRRHSTPWLSTKNRDPAMESKLVTIPFITELSFPKQNGGTSCYGYITSNERNDYRMVETKVSVTLPQLTQSYAQPSSAHKVTSGVDTQPMMIHPKRQRSAKFDLMADDEPSDGDITKGRDKCVTSIGGTEEAPEVQLYRERSRSMGESTLPSLLVKSILPPSKPVRQKSIGGS